MSRREQGKKYAEWPSAVDYTKALKKTVTAVWPFIDLEEVGNVRGKLEWFHIYLSRFNDRQFRVLVKSRTGVDLPPSMDFKGLDGNQRVRVERWLQAERDRWIAEQVRLIESLTDRHAERATQILTQYAGQPEAIKEGLIRVLGMAHNRAELIAEDQFNKGTEVLNRARYQAVGSITYRWVAKHDNRVRPSHVARDGQVFSYNGATNPGWEIRCRCHAEPIFPRNLNPVEVE